MLFDPGLEQLFVVLAVLGIAAVDLALMGFYWGVYVPSYASQDPPSQVP